VSRSSTEPLNVQRDESRLIEKAKRGDRQALGELYNRHVDVVYRYVYARVKDAATAEDLTAQVFLNALEGLQGYEISASPFLSWLYRIAYARIVDHWRKQERRREVDLAGIIPAGGSQPDEFLEAEADWATAIDLIAQLTDDQQDVIILRFIGELSIAEVASTLGKSIGAVKATQHRALASLARLVQERITGELYG
jgi:RNA polymerase sigma-70 factor (ECF subfamily)